MTNEAFSTQTCSCCKARTGPKGRAELNIRNWICEECSTEHDRDINAAKNILARGLVELAEEFSSAAEAKACETALNKTEKSVEAGHGLPVVGIPAL